jgi:sarcosine oxidase
MGFDYEVVVIGTGAMGSAAAYHLAKRGQRVLGLDRFHPPHEFGSSHGRTRIIREAYFEHASYVPLVQRAYELWAELERESGRKLLRQTGGLMIGPPDGALFSGAKRSAEQHKLEHRILSSTELHHEFPSFETPNDFVAVWEPRAGILFPELAIQTHLELAAKNGAEFRFDEPALEWEPSDDGVRVRTHAREITAGRLVLSAGAWMSSLVPELKLPLVIERQVLLWFEPRAQQDTLSHIPVFICEPEPHRYFYGFPDIGDGVKIGIHHQGATANPDKLEREVKRADVDAGRGLLERFLPGAAGSLESATVCMYTNTPDEHFILDQHPGHPQIVVASPCSGHGFKFSPVVGEIAAGMLMGQASHFDLGLFGVGRFGS